MNRAGRTRRRGSRAEEQPAGSRFRQSKRTYKPIEVISADQVHAIHTAALDVLSRQGMRVLHGPARDLLAAAGATIDGAMVRMDPAMVEERIGTAPASFTVEARDPAKSLTVGGDNVVYVSVGGPAYIMDNDRGRRDGSFEDMCNFMRIVQALDVIHQEGGCPCEPMDMPANTRHLDIYLAQIRITDKTWQTQTLGRARTIDGLEMAARMLGADLDGLRDRPVAIGIINTNTPLQLDIPMAEGLIEMSSHGQPLAITPFTLAGAMAPVTIAGTLVLQHAEALFGIALTQIVRPGAPVLYGGFTSNVDMRSGSPAFGTPEYTKAAQASGQLARLIGVPFRSSNVTAANEVDAQAAYESQMSLWGALMGGAHLLEHSAGWMHGGLTASFEKLILDAEMLSMMDAYFEPLAVDTGTLALDAIAEVGPGGHFFGATHTMSRYQTAFWTPMLSNWDNHPQWLERGSVQARERANNIWKSILKEAEDPPLDPAVLESLEEYVARRKAEGGAPMN